ncbi:MAG: carbohydrate kinase [Alicyclobacillaceae bacterium]|nr:carbohydrate kinase [Alicyclobacillaceae bacterium]
MDAVSPLTAVGEVLVDWVSLDLDADVAAARSFEKRAGGAPANVAAAVSRLGGRSAFVGVVGRDPFGEFLISELQRFGVDVKDVRRTDEAKTTMAFVARRGDGERSFVFYRDPGADTRLRLEDLPRDRLAGSQIVHLGSLGLSSSPSREALLEAARWCRESGVIVSFDVNWRPALWPDIRAAREVTQRMAEWIDMIKVNREELELFSGTGDPRLGARFWHEQGIRLVIVTLDRDGCFLSARGPNSRGDRAVEVRMPAYPVRPVDTTGAGDAFLGALYYALLYRAGKGIGWPARLEDEGALREAAGFAVRAAALSTTRRGAMDALPELTEVEVLLKQDL